MPTQLACVDTREHAGELARNGVQSVEKRRTRGRREVRRHKGRRAGELAVTAQTTTWLSMGIDLGKMA